jgi:hypothetical protein
MLKEAHSDATIVVAAKLGSDIAKVAPPQVASMAKAAEDLKSVLLTVKAGDAFDVRCKATAKDAATAEAMRKAATDGLAEAKVNPMLTQPQMKPVADLIKSVKIGGSGTALELSLTLRPDVMSAVQMMLPMIMGGMMGQMGN